MLQLADSGLHFPWDEKCQNTMHCGYINFSTQLKGISFSVSGSISSLLLNYCTYGQRIMMIADRKIECTAVKVPALVL